MKLYVDGKNEGGNNTTTGRVKGVKKTDASVFLRWQLTPSELDNMAKRAEGSMPYVLICVMKVSGDGTKSEDFMEVMRKPFKLKDLATYITFRSSGRHLIYAFTLDGQNTREFLMRDYCGGYPRILNIFRIDEGVGYEKLPCISGKWPKAFIEVDVDEESFATKPADFDLVNSWFSNSPKDECAFRKRRIIYFWLLFWLPIRLVLSLLGIVVLGLGLGIRVERRGLNPLSGKSPFKASSVFLTSADGKIQWWRPLFSPLVWLAGWFVGGISIAHTAAVFSICCYLVALFACLLLYAACLCGLDRYRDYIGRKKSQKIQDEILSLKRVPRISNADVVGIESLPPRKRSWRLWILGFKKRVCRPFAK